MEQDIPSRDDRYKEIIAKQLGPNGIVIITVNAFILVFVILLVLLTSIGIQTWEKPVEPVTPEMDNKAAMVTEST